MIGLALTMSGCALGPDFLPPAAPVQDNWIEKGDKRVSNRELKTNWWRAFKDPTLDTLVHLAAEQNLPVQIAGLRILEARAQLGIAIGEMFPQQQEGSGARDLEQHQQTRRQQGRSAHPRFCRLYHRLRRRLGDRLLGPLPA